MHAERSQLAEIARIGLLVLLFWAAAIVQPGCEAPAGLESGEGEVASSQGEGSGGESTGNEKTGDEKTGDKNESNKSDEGAGLCSHSACGDPNCGVGLCGLGLSNSGLPGLSALAAGVCGKGDSGKGPEDVGSFLGSLPRDPSAPGEGGCGGGLFGPGVPQWGPCGPGGVGRPAGANGATVQSAGGKVHRMVTHPDVATDSSKVSWVAVQPGDQLRGNAILRTGLGSHAVVQLPCGATVCIGSATKVGFAGRNGGSGADLTLKFGSLKVTKGDQTDTSKIRVATPGGTMDLVGPTGGIAYGGVLGLTFYGEGAWERDSWAANPPPSPNHFHVHFVHFAAARKADEVRGHAMAGALGAVRDHNAAIITSGTSGATRATAGSANAGRNVPNLTRIPRVGHAFRRTPQEHSRRNFLILVKPKIIIHDEH